MTDATYKFGPAHLSAPRAQSHVSLVLSWPPDRLHAVALREGHSLVVGRSEPAQLIIEDRSLSRTHARFSLRGGRVHLTDLGSTNGTSVNGQKTGEVLVDEGDAIRLGNVDVRISGPAQADDPGRCLRHDAWMRRLDDEIVRGRVFGRPVCVMAVRAGRTTSEPWLSALRPVDAACAYAPALTLVILVETDASSARGWAEGWRRQAGEASLGVASAPLHATSAEALVAHAIVAARKAKPGGPMEVAESGRERQDLAAPVIASEAMRRLYGLVARVARTTLPVLVLGETGSGKELVARAVHDTSPRAKGPFKALNCATIPGNLIESVLFGHERGAFTGADKQAPGVFEQAQGGTVFLDEVGELSGQAQAALLRVLETKRIVRVGGTKEIEVDVRVVAATHRDLSAMVAAGGFREDLMFRLDALSLRVPPLRERKDEVAALAELFLRRACEQWGSRVRGFSDDALDALSDYCWPGNVRQLKNVIERAVTVCAGDLIELEDLPEHVWTMAEAAGVDLENTAQGRLREGFRSLPDRVREFETGLIRDALAKAHGNQAQAARILGVPRRTLANKVHAYGLL